MTLRAAILFLLTAYTTLCTAKSEHNYKARVQVCIDNDSTITARNTTLGARCGDAFARLMENMPSQKRNIL